MVGYKLSKNDWVTPFFVIFRSVREKLLVTVSFDHPVFGPFLTFIGGDLYLNNSHHGLSIGTRFRPIRTAIVLVTKTCQLKHRFLHDES